MKRECMYACTDYDLLIMYKCVKFCEINIHSYPFRTAHNALRHGIPELLCKFPTARTHSIMSFASHVKFHLIDSYCSECVIPQCYICARST